MMSPTNSLNKRRGIAVMVVAAAVILLLALSFLNFRVAQSRTEVTHTLSTYRTGEMQPENMAPGFTLYYTVEGPEPLAEAVGAALQAELEAAPAVGEAINGDLGSRPAPLLLVQLAPERLWTPVYGRATVQAQIFFADDGDAPWPLAEPVVFRDSPRVKADGEFTLSDTTGGLISRPGYTTHLAQALAEALVDALKADVIAP